MHLNVRMVILLLTQSLKRHKQIYGLHQSNTDRQNISVQIATILRVMLVFRCGTKENLDPAVVKVDEH